MDDNRYQMDDNRYQVVPYQPPVIPARRDVVMLNGVKYTRAYEPIPVRQSLSLRGNPWLMLIGGILAVAVVGTLIVCFVIALMALVAAVVAHALEIGIAIVIMFMAMIMLLIVWTRFRQSGRRY
jgi:hypothetical protein